MFRRVGMLALCVVFVIVCCSRSFCAETNDELAATVSATLHDETENSAQPRIPDALLTFMRAQEPSAVVQYSATDTSEATGTESQSLEPATFADGPRVFARQSLQGAAPAAMLGFAPNPSGQNLAPLAMATADSYWWELSGGYGYPPSADKAIDGLLQRGWESRYGGGHWFSLNWPQPVKINRIFIYRGWPFYPWVAETISQVYYLDVPTGMWKALLSSPLINGGTVPASDFSPVVTDVSFPFIETTSLYFPIQTGPVNPHPNGAVAINEIEVYGSSQEVLSVTPIPQILYIDNTGAGSGILFRATTNEPTTVHFSVRNDSGDVFPIGSADTKVVGADHQAVFTWWGQLPGGALATTGQWWVIASAGSDSKEAWFTVNKVTAGFLGFGTWTHSKDPEGILRKPVDPTGDCPLVDWDQATGHNPGYFDHLSVSDPVNIVSGNLIWSNIDLQLKAAHPLVLARVYNSLDPKIGPFGRGWSSPYLAGLEFVASDVVFINADGGRIRFTPGANGYQAVGDGIALKLDFSDDTGLWSITHPHGDEWNFDRAGRLQRIAKSCCGHGVTDAVLLEYDQIGSLKKVTNPTGQWLSLTSNADGRITQVSDSAGRTCSYSYGSEGELTTFSDPLGRVFQYAYDENGFLTQATAPGSRVTTIAYSDRRVNSITTPDGAVTGFEWQIDSPALFLTDANGTRHEYGFTADWRFSTYAVPEENITKRFVSSGSALIAITNSSGATEQFSFGSNSLPMASTDALGHTTHFLWDADKQRLLSKTDPLGREWQYAWCYRGNLISETNPAGGVSSFTYDSWNNRTSKTDPLGRQTRYQYSENGRRLVQVVDALGGISSFSHDIRGNLVSPSDPLGRTTRFAFDQLDRLTKTVYPDGRFIEIEYDEAGNVAIRRDNLGRETRYGYDLADKLVMLTRPDGTTLGYSYNPTGQKISETDPLGRVTRFTYSPIGLLTKIIYPDGAEETFTYDTESRLVSKTNELGQTSNLEYDQLGRLLATVDPTGARWESQYDAAGRKIVDKDPLGRITTYQLDNLDRITKVIRPDNSCVTSNFDAVGNLLSTVDALGNQWTWVYDNLNRQVKAIQPNGASSTTTFDPAGQVIAETDALNRTTQYTFDNGGRRTATIDALGNVWQNIYDNAGRLIATKDPLGAVSSSTFDIMNRVISQSDPLGNTQAFEFDGAGRRVAKIDAMGKRSITAYDLRDRITSEVDPEGHTVSYGYNLAGQRVSLTDAANRTWRWDYNSLGQVTAEYDPLGNTNRYAFDSVGNRVSWTNGRNQTTTYVFNSMNRLSQISYPDATIATMAYDLEGRELVRSGTTGSVVKTYDSVGNIISETFGPWGKKWQYSFDLVGNRVQAIDPEGNVFKYRWDALNRMVSLDPPERGDEIKFAFDAAGRPVTEERPGVKTVNTFDQAGRLLEMRHDRDHGKDKLIALRRYTYSPVGNRLSMTNENSEVTRFFYNGSDWLTKAAYPDGQQISYSFNPAGDRIEERIETPTVKKIGKNSVIGTDTVVIPLAYDAGGRLVSKASDTFAFDPDGNQVSVVENGEECRYFWSPDNRLVKVEKDIPCDRHGIKHCKKCPQTQIFTTSENYGYLPNDWRRISRTVDGQQFFSVFDNADESHEYQLKLFKDQKEHGCECKCSDHRKPHLNLVRQFIGGPGTDDLELTRFHGRKLWKLKDGLGSTIALTNRGGNTVARVNYDVFGAFRWPDKPGHGLPPCAEMDLDDILDRFDGGRSFGFEHDDTRFGRHFGKIVDPYLFASRRFDTFSNLYWNRNRMYNPRVGRFLSADQVKFKGGPNLWWYVANNPQKYVDSSGNYLEFPESWDKMRMPEGPYVFKQFLNGPFQEASWFEENYPGWISFSKKYYTDLVNDWAVKNSGQSPFNIPDNQTRFPVMPYWKNTNGSLFFWNIGQNPNETETKHGDQPAQPDWYAKWMADKVLGAFAIDLTTPITINYNPQSNTYTWEATMYVEDRLGFDPGDLWPTWLNPARRVKRATWTISGSGSYCPK